MIGAGTVFFFELGDGKRGLGQVIAIDDDVAGVALCGAVWDCEPLLADILEAPIALGHVPLKRGRLACVTVLGEQPVTAEARADGYDAWRTSDPRAVIDAPLAVLMSALI